jgi:hypothetical protein
VNSIFIYFIFLSRLTVNGLAKVCCIQTYYGNSLWKWKVTWFMSEILQCGNDYKWIVLTWLMKFVRCILNTSVSSAIRIKIYSVSLFVYLLSFIRHGIYEQNAWKYCISPDTAPVCKLNYGTKIARILKVGSENYITCFKIASVTCFIKHNKHVIKKKLSKI